MIDPGAPIGANATVTPPVSLSTVRSQNVSMNIVLGAGVASNVSASSSAHFSVHVSNTFLPTRISSNDSPRAFRRLLTAWCGVKRGFDIREFDCLYLKPQWTLDRRQIIASSGLHEFRGRINDPLDAPLVPEYCLLSRHTQRTRVLASCGDAFVQILN